MQLWFSFKGFSNREEAMMFLFKEMKEGICYGYTMNLMDLLMEAPLAGSQDLIDQLDFTKIYFYQILGEFIVDSISSRHEKNHKEFYESFMKVMNQKNEPEKDLIKLDRLFFQFSHPSQKQKSWLFKQASYEILMEKVIDLNKTTIQEIKALFAEEISELNKESVSTNSELNIIGVVHLQENRNQKTSRDMHFFFSMILINIVFMIQALGFQVFLSFQLKNFLLKI